MSILINILLVINVFVSLLIILLVLMQRPKNEGLGAAFGGGMTDNLFGAQTTNVLQTVTRWLGAIFFILTLTLSFCYVRQTTAKSNAQKILSAASATPAPTEESVPPTTPPPGQPADASDTSKAGLPKVPPAGTPPVESKAPSDIPAPASDQPAAQPDGAQADPAPAPAAGENAPAGPGDATPESKPAPDSAPKEDPAPQQ